MKNNIIKIIGLIFAIEAVVVSFMVAGYVFFNLFLAFMMGGFDIPYILLFFVTIFGLACARIFIFACFKITDHYDNSIRIVRYGSIVLLVFMFSLSASFIKEKMSVPLDLLGLGIINIILVIILWFNVRKVI